MKRTITYITVTLALLTAVFLAVAGPALAQDNTTNYYNNSSSNVTAGGWIPGENATLDNVVDMATRLGPYFIGTGSLDPSGTGYVGILLLSVVLVGSTLGAMRGTGMGPVGGTIIGLTLSYGLVSAGLAPSWLQPVLLLCLGLLVALTVKRVVR